MIELNLGVLVLLLFLLLVFLRAPVFVALAAPSIVYFQLTGFSPSYISQQMINVVDSFTLLAIPLYIFLGGLMNHGRIADRIFDFAYDVIGHVTNGLAQVNIATSLVFSGMSGSALADIGGIGRILIHEMKDRGYSGEYSAALTGTSATVGPIFPPSIPLIIYGLLAQVSVLSLFLAGILPALLTVLLLAVGSFLLAYRKDFPKREGRPALDRILKSGYRALPALIAPVLLVGGMLAGYFSAIEAAVVTIAYMIAINTLFYRMFEISYIWKSATESVRLSATIIVILAAAGLFARVVTLEGIDEMFASFLFGISGNTLVILLIVNLFLLILGLFLEPVAALVMATPIVVPPLVELGLDPTHIGIIIVFNLMLGLLTPPLGLSLFMASDISDTKVSAIITELKPYYVILVLALLLITFVPAVSLTIPDAVLG